ncbi:hypothetical protein JX265_013449 [Neoarthrinium moseri]|uniref:Uncharacterized protein n=1 Tax=Neoarthrinium moseri TaxID=1658444 RepID=A0A9P9W8I1_9PEZI|nr:hypothetical protein JX266_012430 [Neoarthrinium moseri]KAI1850170.1 hypothetical protein JX265_013449 [Neoarthrinium moseri]
MAEGEAAWHGSYVDKRRCNHAHTRGHLMQKVYGKNHVAVREVKKIIRRVAGSITMSIREKIHQAAPRSRELRRIIQETSDAPDALRHQENRIAELSKSISRLHRDREWLDQKREAALKQHNAYTGNPARRFAFWMSGQHFKGRQEQEQRDYLDILQQQQEAKRTEQQLEARYNKATTIRTELESIAVRHHEAKKELEFLYGSVFKGPTPEFPQEDAFEKSAEQSLQSYYDAILQVERVQRVITILTEARKDVTDAAGGQLEFKLGRLENAIHKLKSAQALLNQVSGIPPVMLTVIALPAVPIQGSLTEDLDCGSAVSRMRANEETRAWETKVKSRLLAMERNFVLVKVAFVEAKMTLDGKARELRHANDQLQDIRAEIFERVASERAPDPIPQEIEAPPGC